MVSGKEGRPVSGDFILRTSLFLSSPDEDSPKKHSPMGPTNFQLSPVPFDNIVDWGRGETCSDIERGFIQF